MHRAALIAALLLAGCATPAPEAPTPSAEGSAADWSFTSIDGETITSETPSRNATVLFFMATWCSTCKSKAPTLAAVSKEYADRGVATYSLDFDPTESEDKIRSWQARYEQTWPHGIDEGLRMQRLFGVTSQSSVVVLDGEGTMIKRFGYGEVGATALRAAIDQALAA